MGSFVRLLSMIVHCLCIQDQLSLFHIYVIGSIYNWGGSCERPWLSVWSHHTSTSHSSIEVLISGANCIDNSAIRLNSEADCTATPWMAYTHNNIDKLAIPTFSCTEVVIILIWVSCKKLHSFMWIKEKEEGSMFGMLYELETPTSTSFRATLYKLWTSQSRDGCRRAENCYK